ncbi:hypothetical protein I4F81_012363 [Pyropia yezoensis]|uniref:Uncharacterized protein n=1 Tax=Pyropia yezoensis TaxID=2788 RepID=A0ACC3CJ94_PYRYE|nr:hypothetical protein I4F81_012363 [Neopyropia yezoensis]
MVKRRAPGGKRWHVGGSGTKWPARGWVCPQVDGEVTLRVGNAGRLTRATLLPLSPVGVLPSCPPADVPSTVGRRLLAQTPPTSLVFPLFCFCHLMAFLPTPLIAMAAVRRRGHAPSPNGRAGTPPPRTPLSPIARALPGGGGGGSSPLPRVAAGVLAGLLTLGVVTYAGRASLTSAVLSRAVGADVQVGAVEVDLWPRRDEAGGGDGDEGAPPATTTAAAAAADADASQSGSSAKAWAPSPLPPPTLPRPSLSGPVLGLRDVVLSDGAGRVAARVPAVRVRFGRDGDAAAGAAAGERGAGRRAARVADVELLRPQAYLILDAPSLGSSNWGKLAAAAAAARFAAGSPADDDGRSPGSRGAAGAGPSAAAAAGATTAAAAPAVARAAPTFAGVRLRSVAFHGGVDLSVATSVPLSSRSSPSSSAAAAAAAAAGADLRAAGRPLLPAPLHLPAATLAGADCTSVGAVEARLTAAAGSALARAGLDGVAAAAAAGGVPPEVAAAVGATLRSAVGVGGDEARAALDAARAKIRQWKGGVDAVDRGVFQAFGLDHFRELAKTGSDVLDALDAALDEQQGPSPAAEAKPKGR